MRQPAGARAGFGLAVFSSAAFSTSGALGKSLIDAGWSPAAAVSVRVAVATVVLLDALLIRPVVLPAAVELLGRRAWWPTRAPQPASGGPEAAPPRRRATPRIDPTLVKP